MRNLVKRLLGRKSVKNGMWLYALQIFNTVVPLLTLPYITRVLGSEKYGLFAIALNIVGYYQVIVEYGFGMSATRRVALSNNEPRELSNIFTAVIYSRLILLGICAVSTLIYCGINRNNPLLCQCLAALMIMLFGNCVQLNWLFQGTQKMQYISVISIIARVVSVVLIFVFVKSPDDVLLYCFLYSVSPVVSGAIGLAIAIPTFGIRLTAFDPTGIWNELRNGWYVFTTQLSSKVFGAVGITFLGIFSASSEVGVYSAIQKIPNIILMVWAPIGQVLYPISSKKMNSSYQEGRQFVIKIQKVVILIFALLSAAVALFSKQIVGMAFGKEYEPYYFWIIPLLGWMLLSINNNFLGVQTLLASGHDKAYSECFQVGVCCTIFFNLIFIYFLGGNGACVAPILSEVVLSIVLNKRVKGFDNI